MHVSRIQSFRVYDNDERHMLGGRYQQTPGRRIQQCHGFTASMKSPCNDNQKRMRLFLRRRLFYRFIYVERVPFGYLFHVLYSIISMFHPSK
jgi:hypothetical protein